MIELPKLLGNVTPDKYQKDKHQGVRDDVRGYCVQIGIVEILCRVAQRVSPTRWERGESDSMQDKQDTEVDQNKTAIDYSCGQA